MIMADVLTWFLIIVGSLMVFIAHWLGAYALFPNIVAACSERYGKRPVTATLLGLVVLVPTLIVAGVVSKKLANPAVGALVVVFLAVPALLALLGSAGLALRIGTGLSSERDAGEPWRRTLRGGVVLGLVFVLPVLGWFVMLPWVLVSGFGTALMTLLAARRAPVMPSPELSA